MKSSLVAIEDEEYNREFYLHSQDELECCSRGICDYVKVLLPDEKSDWKYYFSGKQQAEVPAVYTTKPRKLS